MLRIYSSKTSIVEPILLIHYVYRQLIIQPNQIDRYGLVKDEMSIEYCHLKS